MGYEIAIKVRKSWIAEEDKLAKYIARIVAYDDTGCELDKRGGYKWQLDYRSNDWWMTGIGDDGVVKVAYRYGYGHIEAMEALQKFLQWKVGHNE